MAKNRCGTISHGFPTDLYGFPMVFPGDLSPNVARQDSDMALEGLGVDVPGAGQKDE